MQGESRQGRQGSHQRSRTRAQQVHNRRFALAVCVLALAVVVTAIASYSSRAEASSDSAANVSEDTVTTTLDPMSGLVTATYTASLTGDYDKVGSGRAVLTLHYDANFETLSYVLDIVSPLGSPGVATICQGHPGEIGTTVFTIFAGPTVAGNFSGILAQGYVDASDLVGTLQGKGLADLALLLKNGEAYATMGTASLPIDAVRGQIQ